MLKGTPHSKKKNIMLVIPNLYGGGAERVTAQICKTLDKDLFNVCVCYLKDKADMGEELEKTGYDIIALPKSKFFKNNYFSFLDIRNIVKQKNIDLIHSHLTEALIEISIYNLLFPGIKMIHTFHFGNYPHMEKKYLMLEKIFSKVPDKLIAVGNEQKNIIKNAFRIPDDKIDTIWNGVEIRTDCADHEILKSFTKDGRIVLASLSTLIEQKGLTHLLDVINILKKKHNNFIFIIVGEGPLRNELEAKRKNLGLEDKVFFLGWLENAASRILPVIDIFVQSSLWEAMSVVLLEAMAAGKPIVTTNVGENKHIVEDGDNGFMVEPKDTIAMAKALEKLILNEELRVRFGLKAKQKYEKYFTAAIMTRKYEKIYLDILNK